MSTSPSGARDEVTQLYSSFVLNEMAQMAPSALIVYEYLLTFDQEIALFWKRKVTGATVLFLATRYLALLSYPLLGWAQYANMSDKSCAVLSHVQAYVSVVQYPVWAAFSGLRTLALGEMNWVLASAGFFLALGPFAINLWVIPVSLIGINLPHYGCGSTSTLASNKAVMGVAIARSCSIAADLLVIAVTWRSQLAGTGSFPGRSSSSLGNVMVVNGTLYFLVIAILNVIQLVFTPLSILVGVEKISEVPAFTDPMSAILICRFLLELQHAHQKALDQGSITLIREDGDLGAHAASSLRFTSAVIGSIGASIGAGPEASMPGIYGDDDSDQPDGVAE